jgi:hypothetical protein
VSDGGSAADKAKAALAAAQSGGGQPSSAKGPQVTVPITWGAGSYLKPVNEGQFDGDIHTQAPGNVRDKTNLSKTDYLTPEAAAGAWYSFSDDQRSGLMKRMWFLGLTKSATDFDGAFSVWKNAVGHAANFALSGRQIDPKDVLEMMADGSEGADGKGKYRQQESVHRSIDLTDPATAREWVQQAFHQSMGRKAEDAEVRALVDALHERQKSNPQVTTSTPTKWDENGNAVDSTTTQTGGVDPDAFFAAQMATDPEAGAHQAASTLFPALMQALGSAV